MIPEWTKHESGQFVRVLELTDFQKRYIRAMFPDGEKFDDQLLECYDISEMD